MEKKMMRCIRCDGRKKMFTMNGGYTHANMGGPQVDCPMCLGKGKIPVIEEATAEIKEEIKKEITEVINKKEKESKDAKKRTEGKRETL